MAEEVDLFKYRFQVEAQDGPENFECIRNFFD